MMPLPGSQVVTFRFVPLRQSQVAESEVSDKANMLRDLVAYSAGLVKAVTA